MILVKKYFSGIALSLCLALLASSLSNTIYIQRLGFSPIVMAIIVGLLIGNTFYPKLSSYCQLGVDFSKAKILRLAIILFGIKLTFQEIALVGYKGITIDILMVLLTFILAMWAGIKLFRLDPNSAILIGSGCAICGAAAVIATESIIKASTEKVTIAVAVVVIFGTIGMFVYPLIYTYLMTFFSIADKEFGVYIGSTVHEVAQVVAAADAINNQVVETAVISKMIRVLLLAPFLLMLSVFLLKKINTYHDEHHQHKQKLVIPWFAVGFLGMACLNSFHIIPTALVNFIIELDNVLLAMSMAALGLTSHYSAFQKAGIQPLLLGLFLFIWLIVGGGIINTVINFIWP